jgi:hypothetical protein
MRLAFTLKGRTTNNCHWLQVGLTNSMLKHPPRLLVLKSEIYFMKFVSHSGRADKRLPRQPNEDRRLFRVGIDGWKNSGKLFRLKSC